MDNKELGKWGEEKASAFLLKQGYEIIKKNYNTKIGEIDIIARINNILVFIEVKTRRTTNYGTPEAAVDINKQKKIRKVAECFILNYSQKYETIRFDVVSININKGKGKLRHYKNAF